MNTSALKSFAPAVRNQLLEAVERKLDYALTADTPDLREKGTQAASLRRQADDDRDALIERAAYTWFNRLAALRFLDARHWHPFRSRVLTPATEEETQPEILKQFRNGSLPDELAPFVDAERLRDLLNGRLPTAIAGADPQGEVYRHLILAACRYYHALMPFMFEEIDDETELLLPDDLLTQASPAEGFRTEISDDACQDVEIIGWLYQFYISEKKDQVFAASRRTNALPRTSPPHAALHPALDRPLPGGELARPPLAAQPADLRAGRRMDYYIESRGDEARDSLKIAHARGDQVLDPACGSGHMLTYAFDLLVRDLRGGGPRPSEIPEKILTHNLFGLEICPRAAQLAQFALVCKAREQSRSAFRRPVQPQIMCLCDVVIPPEDMQAWSAATGVKLSQDELSQIHQFRENTETFGALIQPVLDGEKLAALVAKIGEQAPAGDLLVQNTHRKLRVVLDQAEMLSCRYLAVVVNPPYMGSKVINSVQKSFLESHYAHFKYDLFSAFMVRCLILCQSGGQLGFMTPFVWMFLARYERLRELLIGNATITSLIQLEYSGFEAATVPICTFTLTNRRQLGYSGSYIRLAEFRGPAVQEPRALEAIKNPECGWCYRCDSDDFKKVVGSPIAYWIESAVRDVFDTVKPLRMSADAVQGMATCDNERFLRFWHEIERPKIAMNCSSHAESLVRSEKWYPYNKGGSFRRWWGNNEYVVNWKNDGEELKEFVEKLNKTNPGGRLKNQNYYFLENLTYSSLSSGTFSCRYNPPGFLFDTKGSCIFSSKSLFHLLGFLNSSLTQRMLDILCPTLDYSSIGINNLPYAEAESGARFAEPCIQLARADWDNFETSWDFRDLPLLRSGDWEVEPSQPGGAWKGRSLAESWANYAAYCTAAIRRMQELETENNRLWIDAYGLQDELTPEVPEDEITLARADARKDMAAFLSYAVGCMMGRYSLDHPGLILADAGDTVENYLTKVGKPLDEIQFPPDEDSIIPVLDGEWFEDDIVARTREFLHVTFGEDTLNENLRFIEESLGKPLRKYFLTDFYKDHLKTYKKRPIYWLFQSPKKGFNALIYLHRYTPDSLNLLLNDYLRDYLKKIETRLQHLDHTQATTTVTREKTAARKEADKLRKTQKECQDWERDTLLPLAQQRIPIDLDDGVKANYPKFAGAIAKVAGL